MHILVAPNAFKNSLSAGDAAEAIRQGLIKSGLLCNVVCFPIGDGGDGTGQLIVKNKNGFFKEMEVHDPLGRKIKSRIGFIDAGKTAVIELSDASGLKLLQNHEFDPLHTSSFGTGELIRTALDTGCRKIIVCIGGSATVDAGCGILRALGLRFLDSSKKELESLPEDLVYLNAIDLSGTDERIKQTELILLCDVNNILLGATGAAKVFGPQKGASPEGIIKLENAIQKLREIALIQTGRDMNSMRHGGAAGGVAAGLHIFLNAKLVSGIEYFLDITGFDNACRKAEILITGEGSIDHQTLEGKGPVGAARRAKKINIPVIGMAGQISLETNDRLHQFFDRLIAINNREDDIKTSMQNTADNLQKAAFEIGLKMK